MENHYIIVDGELCHHGTKGMKWGIRRYQNKDGSLTPAGRKRYSDPLDSWKAKREAKKQAKAKAKAERDAKKTATAYKRKSIEDMSPEELRAAIDRARLEDTYRSLRPEPVSKGKQFAQTLSKITVNAMEDQGKKLLGKLGDAIIKKFLPEQVDELAALKKEKDILGLKKDIDDLKNPKEKELSWEDRLKKQQYEDNERKRAKAEAEESDLRRQAIKEEEERLADWKRKKDLEKAESDYRKARDENAEGREADAEKARREAEADRVYEAYEDDASSKSRPRTNSSEESRSAATNMYKQTRKLANARRNLGAAMSDENADVTEAEVRRRLTDVFGYADSSASSVTSSGSVSSGADFASAFSDVTFDD